jgi:hypothetical protein
MNSTLKQTLQKFQQLHESGVSDTCFPNASTRLVTKQASVFSQFGPGLPISDIILKKAPKINTEPERKRVGFWSILCQKTPLIGCSSCWVSLCEKV